ncbi:hypothetical protein NEMBOFW57_010697 [Staphylotrichum longicolle]|uniref:DUF1996 domain-containing protein n=1 Tax=Staphylotrichum longicolle TaxID=669026 RepID=A0AAD4HVI0_9PEZI|nr:hypothetical protein NEMBOFW57_010697 [Staphylotrichum longicolle]
MDPATHDLVKGSTCTSCTFTEDLSNYWTAVLYFRARNGTYKGVRQLPNLGLGGNGGITVYYIPPHDRNVSVTAFKPGFRMLVGDAASDKPGQDPKVCHRCMPKEGDKSNLNCAAPDTKTLPKEPCVGGIRSVITFPTCWDGTHPVKIPQVMLETIWDTTPFADKDLWPEDGSQPFVWSTNDKTGYTQHGDYVFGWKDNSLQRAMDARCTGDVCSELQHQTFEESIKCTLPQTVEDDVDGWVTHIPGQSPMV